MTSEQKKQVARIGKELKALFPDFYGSLRFNLNPTRNDVNVNIEQSMKLKSNK